MTEIQPFTFPATDQEVRVLMLDGEPWFVAADVCTILGLGNPTQAVARLEDDEYRQVEPTLISNEGRGPRRLIVNEPGLYSLILGSRKPDARAFKRWVTRDVLPTIRKTGRFELVPQPPQWEIPKTYPDALELAAKQAREILAKDEEIEQQRAALDWAEPRAAYVDRYVDGANDACTVRDLAKQLGEQEKLLRAWLVKRGLIYVIKTNGPNEYRPRAMVGPRRHWFDLKDQPQAPRYHNNQMRKTLYITPAGKTGIEALLLKYPIIGQGELDIDEAS